jgi:hypothetical protein
MYHWFRVNEGTFEAYSEPANPLLPRFLSLNAPKETVLAVPLVMPSTWWTYPPDMLVTPARFYTLPSRVRFTTLMISRTTISDDPWNLWDDASSRGRQIPYCGETLDDFEL